MLSLITRASARRSQRGIRALEALASPGGGEGTSAIIIAQPLTSTSSSSSFFAFSSVAPPSSSSPSHLLASRGFAAKPHSEIFGRERRRNKGIESPFLSASSLLTEDKQKWKKNAENNKKRGGGGRKRDDSDSDDDEGATAAASSSTSSSSGGGGGSNTFDLEATKAKMVTAVERLKKALSGLHVGRASPSMLEHVPVTLVTTTEGGAAEESSSSSSNTLPLQALAAVTARDANTLVVTPFDPTPATAAAITSALRLPPLKLDARVERSGELVVPVPRATPEAVAALAKLARAEAEAARVAVRSARKDANAAARSKKELSEDARRKNEKAVQAAADEFSKKVDAALAAKEADLAAV